MIQECGRILEGIVHDNVGILSGVLYRLPCILSHAFLLIIGSSSNARALIPLHAGEYGVHGNLHRRRLLLGELVC